MSSREAVERMWQRKDDVDVPGGHELRKSILEPPLFRERRALRAVPVAAGAIDRAAVPTSATHLDVPSHLGSAASCDGGQSDALLACERTSRRQLDATCADDVSELGSSRPPAVPAARRHDSRPRAVQ
jgi:hypothetical protein